MTNETPAARPAYIWFDTEFTDLDVNKANLLQVSMLVTDVSLNRLAPREQDANIHIKLDPTCSVSEWVQDNIPALLEECRSPNAVTVEEADRMLVEKLEQIQEVSNLEAGQKPMLAGNTIHMDMALVRRFLPRFADRLHYRMLDVSVLKVIWLDWLNGETFDKDDAALLERYLPEDCGLPKGMAHDAYYDIHASLAELRFYREKLGLKKPETT